MTAARPMEKSGCVQAGGEIESSGSFGTVHSTRPMLNYCCANTDEHVRA
jgi:hypothetical protein